MTVKSPTTRRDFDPLTGYPPCLQHPDLDCLPECECGLAGQCARDVQSDPAPSQTTKAGSMPQNIFRWGCGSVEADENFVCLHHDGLEHTMAIDSGSMRAIAKWLLNVLPPEESTDP